MGLLRRVAIGKNGPRKDRATSLLNQGYAHKHADFNQHLVAEIVAKELVVSGPSSVVSDTARINGHQITDNG